MGLVDCCIIDSMYINELWMYNCGDDNNALTIFMSFLYMLLCSDLLVILISALSSPSLSWDHPNEDDLGRVALLGRGATDTDLRAVAFFIVV